MGWQGIYNGKLIKLLIDHDFSILLTGDKNLPHQQNIVNLPLSIIVFKTLFMKIEDLRPFVPEVLDLLPKAEAGNIYNVG